MDFSDLITLYFGFWFITIPLTVYLIYKLATELLDLVFNTGRIDELLKHSDHLDLDVLEKDHSENFKLKDQISESNMLELQRQMDYLKLKEEEKRSWSRKYSSDDKIRIYNAKNLTDIFKVRES